MNDYRCMAGAMYTLINGWRDLFLMMFFSLSPKLDPLPDEVVQQRPNANAVQSMENVLEIQGE